MMFINSQFEQITGLDRSLGWIHKYYYSKLKRNDKSSQLKNDLEWGLIYYSVVHNLKYPSQNLFVLYDVD